MAKTLKGVYRPRNPEKYRGDARQIVYRSSWERTFMKYCDLTESIKSWASEEICIHYYDPVSKKKRRYFPDFVIRYVDTDGLIITELVEIKPHKEVVGPDKNPKRKTKSWLYAVHTYCTNMAKWEAAERFCEDRGWRWRIVTEYDLGLKKRK